LIITDPEKRHIVNSYELPSFVVLFTIFRKYTRGVLAGNKIQGKDYIPFPFVSGSEKDRTAFRYPLSRHWRGG
jgi:hypothetical protein